MFRQPMRDEKTVSDTRNIVVVWDISDSGQVSTY